MSDQSAEDVVTAYRDARDRICAIVLEARPDEIDSVVPACAPWTVTQLLAHLVSMPAAISAGARPTKEINAWLADLIDERRGQSVQDLVAEWQRLDNALPPLLTGGSQLLYGDLAVHEHDLRAALGKPDHQALDVDAMLPRTLAALAHPLREAGLGAIAVDDGQRTWRSHDAGPGWTLLTDAWTAVRAVNSRRTAEELQALPARGDATAYLAILDAHLPLPKQSLREP